MKDILPKICVMNARVIRAVVDFVNHVVSIEVVITSVTDSII